ncbi:TPR end-of-group domain-containing protein [Mucilaginibacter rubeus]|uniref:Uncharacterized protein n=1 Tax=Mucilaginibacter rubeus TaxID=2027860 RepID=A0A5C1HTP8_9SPHI|nr:DUF2268 domain-containing putative Zn-dependent protease [Mucilaginibacter rubeus]QEM08813.1 hypothetical protein DEO27_001845 [Mucilaginibacter rubeus]
MYKYLTFFFTLLCSAVFGQKSLSSKGDSLYEAKNFIQAGSCYLQSARQAEFKASATGDYYNAACCYALAGKADSAMTILKLAASSGYKNAAHLVTDSDLNSLHQMPDWRPLLNSVEKTKGFTDDPSKVHLVTTDVKNFWTAYDLAQKDTANRLKIYRQYYVDPGSPGLQDYFAYKVVSMKRFVRGHDKKPKFYAAIRKNTFTVDKQKPQMMASFAKFKEIYAQGKLPDVYFIIGSFSSGGTSTDNGLLIGLDQAVRTADIPVDELSLWEKNNFGKLDYLPNLVAHELIHYNQGGMLGGDTTLLRAVLVEGMADFLGELISSRTANERLHVWAKGHEKQIWADFEKEMYLKRAYNWIANSNQETADKPSDLGYWVGYQICKGYYDNSADKKQAIYDMLNIKDYKAFYEKSGTSKKFGN